MKRMESLIAMVVLLVAIGACVGLPAYQPYQVRFWVDVTQAADGRSVINLKVHNTSTGGSASLDDANASMELRDEDGVLRASMQIFSLPALEQDQSADIAIWRGQLDPGSYQLFWGAPGLGHSVGTFNVSGMEGRLVLGEVQTIAYPDREMPSLPPYGAAQPFVDLAIAELARKCDADPELIVPLRVEAVDFPDASLGVPEPGKMAAQMITPGYVMELSCAGRIYTYHAGADRVVLAGVPEESALPAGSIRIVSVEAGGGQVVVRGRSTLPDGACLATELWQGGAAAQWWPVDQCAVVANGAWKLTAVLGEGEAPCELDPNGSYVLGAWLPGGPNIVYTFPFDLVGPPAGAGPEPTPTQALPMTVKVGGAGISFEVPDDWERGAGWTWRPPGMDGPLLGFQWGNVAPSSHPEAIFLPPNALMLGSEVVDFGWATGRWYELEVYQQPAQGYAGGHIVGYERHVIILTEGEDSHIGLDFYARASTRAGLAQLRPLIEGMVSTAREMP